MNTEIVAIGDAAKIRDIVGDFDHVEEDDVFVASVPSTCCRSIIASLTSEGIRAVPYRQFLKTIQSAQKYTPLTKIDSAEAFRWFRTGLEFFGVTYSGSFEMYSVDRKDVRACTRADQIGSCTMSNNGAIYGFARGLSASFHANDSMDLIFDVRLEEAIESMVFNPTDTYVALRTSSTVELYDIFRGRFLGSFKAQPFHLTAEHIHLCGDDIVCRFDSADLGCIADRIDRLELRPSRRVVACDKDRVARFTDGKIQRIVYESAKCTMSKTYAYIKDVQFVFSDNGLYVLITKNTGSHDQYILENFMDNKIATLSLDFRPELISVSDSQLVLQSSDFEVGFFSRDRYTFRKVKSIRKEGPVLVALRNSVCAIYDSESGHIEFYDKMELRSAYSHPDCAGLLWSQSGLYLGSFCRSETSGCLVQVFDSNGVLMFKRVFGSLKDFSWRPFASIDQETRERILEEHCEEDIMEDTEEARGVDELLAEWKSYLLSKIHAK